MKVFQNIKERNLAYDKILRCIYKCKTINENFFNIVAGISEDEFVKKCFKPNKIPPEEFIKRIDKEFTTVNQLQIMSENSTVRMWLMIRTDSLLKNTYKDDMLSLFSDVFLLIEKIDNDENFLMNLFMNLKIFFNYKDIFYIFSLLQTSECKLNHKAVKTKDIDKYFFYSLKSTLELINAKQLISIIGENRIKWYFLLLFDKVIFEIEHGSFKNNHKFLLFIKTFNTYKWLDLKRKNKLNKLMKYNIFYRKYAETDEKYLSEMIFKQLNDECLII